MKTEILKQVTDRGLSSEVTNWFSKRLTDQTTLTEAEHIIDWIIAKSPKKLQRMRWDEALISAEKWSKTEQKKGRNIKEVEADVKEFMKVGEFTVVQLIGEAAYKREGHLMKHCVASYFGKSGVKVYSLRDSKNEPHCTIEVVGEDQIQQIKGKGNGSIHPNYIEAVVLFLEKLGMTVRDSEMENLGYVNLEKFLLEIGNKEEIKDLFFKDKFFPKNQREKLKDQEGKVINHIGLLDYFPLIEDSGQKIKVAFDISNLFRLSIEWIKKGTKTNLCKKDNYNQIAADNDDQIAVNNYNQIAADDDNKIAANDNNQIAVNNSNQIAADDYNQIAADDYNQIAADDSNQIAANYSNQIAADDSNKIAADDYNQIAADDSNQIAADDSNQIAANDYNKIAANDDNQIAANYSNQIAVNNSNKIAVDDYNQIAADDYNQIAADDSNKIACGWRNKITLSGTHNVVVAGNESKIKGKKGSLIVLYEIKNSKIENHAVAMIDGKIIKEDTWYQLIDGKFVEVKE